MLSTSSSCSLCWSDGFHVFGSFIGKQWFDWQQFELWTRKQQHACSGQLGSAPCVLLIVGLLVQKTHE